MNSSKKILALVVGMCLFMASTSFMVYASIQPSPVFSVQNAKGGTSVATSKTPTSKPVTTTPPTSTPPTSTPPTSTPEPPQTSQTPTSKPVEKSSNCYLSNLTVVRGTLTPAFNKEVTQYSVVIRGGEGVPGVKPTAEHKKASVKKNVPVLAMGGYATATVVVTAEDGTQRTYTLNMTREPGDSSTAPSSSEDLSSISGFDVSGDYPSENSLDISGLFGSDEGIISETSSDDDTAGTTGSNWLLYVGIVLIIGALGGIGFAIYRQFFAKPKGGYDDYGDDGYYDDGYGDYGDYDGDGGYNGPYDDGGYDDGYSGGYTDDGYADGGYTDDGYADGTYSDGGYPEDNVPVEDGTGYGTQSDLYDEPTTYIPQTPQDGNYDEYRSQQGQYSGYTRRGGGPGGGRAQPPGQYRRGGQSQGRPPRGNNGRRGDR